MLKDIKWVRGSENVVKFGIFMGLRDVCSLSFLGIDFKC